MDFIEWIGQTKKELQNAVNNNIDKAINMRINERKASLVSLYSLYKTIQSQQKIAQLNKKLVYATWVLAGGTIILAIATIILVIVTLCLGII